MPQLNGLVAQLGAHHIRIVGVGSSNLLKSTKRKAIERWLFLFLQDADRKNWLQFLTGYDSIFLA